MGGRYYFQAKIYKGTVVRNTIEANSIEMLRAKCEPFIEKESIDSIIVSKIEDLGYFKLPKPFKEIAKELLI